MPLFIFILTTMTAQGQFVYVEDYNLSGEDCITRMQEYYQENPDLSDGIPACEFDHAGSWAGTDFVNRSDRNP